MLGVTLEFRALAIDVLQIIETNLMRIHDGLDVTAATSLAPAKRVGAGPIGLPGGRRRQVLDPIQKPIEAIDEAIENIKEATELYLEEFPVPEFSRPLITSFEVAVSAPAE